jgi:putative FmdB family regulatory protein
MPTYEYRCPNRHQFDLFQKMSEEPRANCPECGEESERLLSGGVGFLFKGDGFYITDSRSDSYKKEASKEAAPEVSTSTSDTAPPKKDDAKAPSPSPKPGSTPSKGS